jgi:hypothetical protein
MARSKCAIEQETRQAGGAGWHLSEALLEEGCSVALWSNTPGADANGRVFVRLAETHPRWCLLQPAVPCLETPYCVSLCDAERCFATLWRNEIATHVPVPDASDLPLFRAAVIGESTSEWRDQAQRWREQGLPVFDSGEQGQGELKEWAHKLLLR